MLRRLVLAVFLLASFLLAGGCGPQDPLLELRMAREAHTTTLRSWAEAPPSEASETRQAQLTINVTSGRSPIPLPCLTVDVLFYGEEGAEEPIETTTVELDTADLEARGGAKDVTVRLSLPEGPVEGLAIVLHPAETEEALRALCEGRVLSTSGT
jgi:hypothetical protein